MEGEELYYTPLKVEQWGISWVVEYVNYRGDRPWLWVNGRDELSAYANAVKALDRLKRRTDKRHKQKKEQQQ